ncbi:hypothetical protein F4802DRAFT_574104 [Xylaria palmicola]|nr:hypothetical protein F4802DRAFT_574104 [Xylaria palmicola]
MDFVSPDERLEWQYEHRDETRVPGLIAACIISTIISTIIIALRLISRRLFYGRIRIDASDWLVIVAWALLATVNVSAGISAIHGVGRHLIAVTDVHKVQILAIISESTYILSITFVKFSVLALYLKVFPGQKFRYCVWGVAAFIASWATSGVIVAIFQCSSIEYVWKPDSQQFCVDFALRNLISGIMNVLTDIVIMGMVIPLVWNAPKRVQKKWLVAVPFVTGAITCIISIVRLPYSLQTGTSDATWIAAAITIVSIVEITVGMLAISIPTYRPLYEHLFRGGVRGNNDNTCDCGYKEALHMGLYGGEAQSNVKVTSPGTHVGSDHGGINVTNHIELVRHTKKSGNWVRVTDEDEEEELCVSGDQIRTRGT